ncbi:MAG: serine/threonine protein phosphatase [Xanthomonadales bacterium]|nr:serine/threonine protein phosphatase [Xanthomonadales bacterium]
MDVTYTPPWLPPGRRVYSIGDIHGRLDLLEELHEMIREDAADYDGAKAIIYLGDFIDRGAQSKQVVDRLIEQPLDGFEAIHILGNHEQAMLDFLEHPEAAAAWLNFGGQVTLLSYGAGLGRVQMARQVHLLRDELDAKLPQSHREFLASCRLMHVEGSYCFAHAGIRPGVSLDQQKAEDLMWIREEFCRSREDHGCIVVHGHSITEEVEWQPNRIGIDTGAYYSGLLTALVLEGDQQRLLQTGRSG